MFATAADILTLFMWLFSFLGSYMLSRHHAGVIPWLFFLIANILMIVFGFIEEHLFLILQGCTFMYTSLLALAKFGIPYYEMALRLLYFDYYFRLFITHLVRGLTTPLTLLWRRYLST